jgi:hypothetical protein
VYGEEGTAMLLTGVLPADAVQGDAALADDVLGHARAHPLFQKVEEIARQLHNLSEAAARVRVQAETRADMAKADAQIAAVLDECNQAGEADDMYLRMQLPFMDRLSSAFKHAAVAAEGELMGMAPRGEAALAEMLGDFIPPGSIKGGTVCRVLGNSWRVPSTVVAVAVARARLEQHLEEVHGDAGRDAVADAAVFVTSRMHELEQEHNLLAGVGVPNDAGGLIEALVGEIGPCQRMLDLVDDLQHNVIPSADPANYDFMLDEMTAWANDTRDNAPCMQHERRLREALAPLPVDALQNMLIVHKVFAPRPSRRPSRAGVTSPCTRDCPAAPFFYSFDGVFQAKVGNSGRGPVRPMEQTDAYFFGDLVGSFKWHAEGQLSCPRPAYDAHTRSIINAMESLLSVAFGHLRKNFAGQPSTATYLEGGVLARRQQPGDIILVVASTGHASVAAGSRTGPNRGRLRFLGGGLQATWGVRSMAYSVQEATMSLVSVWSSAVYAPVCVKGALPQHDAPLADKIAATVLRNDVETIGGVLHAVKAANVAWSGLHPMWRAMRQVRRVRRLVAEVGATSAAPHFSTLVSLTHFF